VNVLAHHKPASGTPCFPISHVSGTALPVQRTGIVAFDEDYQQPAAPERCTQSRRIPEWLIANRFGHRQVIHILQCHEHKPQRGSTRITLEHQSPTVLIGTRPSPSPSPYPSQYIPLDGPIYDSVQEMPVHPPRGGRTWAEMNHPYFRPTPSPPMGAHLSSGAEQKEGATFT